MTENYVVEVTEISRPLNPESLERLAKKFNSQPDKLAKLIRVLPGIATKGISKEEASVVASYFNEEGMIALIKPERLAYHPQAVAPAPIRPESSSRFEAALSKLRSSANDTPVPASPTEKPRRNFEKKRVSFTPHPEEQKEPLPVFPSKRAGRSSRKSSDSVHDLNPYETQERVIKSKTQESLRRKLLLTLLGAVILTGLGTVAIASYNLWTGLKEQSLQAAMLSTQSSAATLSRSIEANGDISQFLDLPSPVPSQTNLSTRLVVSSTLDSSPFATWPKNAVIDEDLAALIRAQADRAVERNSSEQSQVNKNKNPLVSGLIVSTQPLEHGSAIVGSVTTVFSYEPLLTHMKNLLLKTALLSLLPMAFALVLGFFVIQALTKQLYTLIHAAEAISKGQLSEPVSSRGSAELKDLSTSLERLRVSTKTSLERLRERRDRGF